MTTPNTKAVGARTSGCAELTRPRHPDRLEHPPALELLDDHAGVERVGLELVVRLEAADVVRTRPPDPGTEGGELGRELGADARMRTDPLPSLSSRRTNFCESIYSTR